MVVTYNGFPVEITADRPASPVDYPHYVGTTFIPEALDFHVPEKNSIIPLDNDINTCYHQMISWCMIQSYWFWVCSAPKASDKEFDWAKGMIELYEEECSEELTVGPIPPHVPLGYSPTVTWWGWNSSRYPSYIQSMFNRVPIKRYMPVLRDTCIVEKKEPKYVRKLIVKTRKG